MTTRSPFGAEFATFKVGQAPDLDPTFRIISGEQVVVQAVLRSWLTPRDSAVDGEGRDLRSYAQMRTSATNRARCKAQLKAQAERDERVQRADVRVENIGNVLRITGRITPLQGKDFRLVLDASELSATLVSVQYEVT